MMMKKLSRIRLINWHYFVNETIEVNGSFLVSGENTAGKSTVLDAIQLVLTTNHRRFNTAANEKSNRNLKGYVRCKTGNEDNVYIRKGSVISYVALEFYEQKAGKYFVLGAKMDSPDEDSALTTRWFREEGRLDDLSFLTGERPSTAEEFRKNNKKVQLIQQLTEAKARFSQRLGNLDERFFDMIPKSLAFKPMDNIKDFINRFILSEKTIEVATLRNNIASLKEFEDLMDLTKAKIEMLKTILYKSDDVCQKDREIKTHDIMIKKAEIEAKKIEQERISFEILSMEQQLKEIQFQESVLKTSLENDRKRITDLNIALEKNESTQLIVQTKHRIELLEKDRTVAQAEVDKLKNMLGIISDTLALLGKDDIFIVSKEELLQLGQPNDELADKSQTVVTLKNGLSQIEDKVNTEGVRNKDNLDHKKVEKGILEQEINNLKNKKLTYPENTIKLKEAIEKEFKKNSIMQEVRIFSELLEVTDSLWQNAVEGYLNTQRFYLIVEPQYYKLALEVYNRIKKEIHTVGLINTAKLDINQEATIESLAYVVKSDNRYAKAYVNYLLNKVIRCNHVNELKEHKVAITMDCMLYQNYAVRKINEQIYYTPFIGAYAFATQLKVKQESFQGIRATIEMLEAQLKKTKGLLSYISQCNMEVIEANLQGPDRLKTYQEEILKEKQELKKAESNPNYLEIKFQIDDCSAIIEKKELEYTAMHQKIGQMKTRIEEYRKAVEANRDKIKYLENQFEVLLNEDEELATLGLAKYEEQRRSKEPATIVQNFSPYRTNLENRKSESITELIGFQSKYCSKYDADLSIGYESMQEYIDENYKLNASELIKYEEELKKAKDNCHLEFRESFLARLKEHIETAKMEFRNLNSALKDVYYGDDSYKFELTHNKKKESIYSMIMSKNNEIGFNIWSQEFNDEYKEEMEDLFAKLTAYDDHGEKVLTEYTDYRNYLDYDIHVEKKDGNTQKFSKIYGEKSGGETQTPYYVAIAASFVQLYKLGDTIRIIMFDEAFDKMDDNRIAAMMDFLNSQDFQIILATPPAKVEIIGEKVDTILMAMREGTRSIIETYDL